MAIEVENRLTKKLERMYSRLDDLTGERDRALTERRALQKKLANIQQIILLKDAPEDRLIRIQKELGNG